MCGNDITIADYFGAGLLSAGDVVRCNLDAYPNLSRWMRYMKRLPSWSGITEVFYGFADSVKEQSFTGI